VTGWVVVSRSERANRVTRRARLERRQGYA
jgi:hypothetical protein